MTVEMFTVSLVQFKDYQHKQREELERKTRLNSVDFYNFDRKGILWFLSYIPNSLMPGVNRRYMYI